MRVTLRLAIGLPVGGLLLAVLGCGGDAVTAPSTGSLAITTATSGPEPDADGYTVSIDGGIEVAIGVNGSHRQENMEPGNHTVRLGGVAPNCGIAGDNPHAVAVNPGSSATVAFTVTCGVAGGGLTIMANTSGISIDPDGYTVAIDGAVQGTVLATGSTSVQGMSAGDHRVGLEGVAANCQVQGDNPRTVTVTAAGNASLQFEITCTGPQSLKISWAKGQLDARENAQYDIYSMSADGSGQTRLTNPPATHIDHQWSPDGRRVLFVRGDDIYVMNADGSGQARLTNPPGGGMDPQWSPDGTRIAYSGNTGTDVDIYVMKADGTGKINLTRGGPHASQPRWSPDGRKIVFLRDFTDGAQANLDIYVANSDGSGESPLTQNPVDAHRDLDRDPVWSPDGTRIAFSRERDDVADIYVVNASGGNPIQLTHSPALNEKTPAWAPDGRRIAYLGGGDILIMNADGSGQTNLTNTPSAEELWPAWSLDGTKIAFTRRTPPAFSGEIWVMGADGGNPLQLTHTPDSEDDMNPRWQP